MKKKNVYKRELYLKRIRPFYDDDMIKVITGIRRCGKSYLMLSIIQELLEKGVPGKDIIYLDLDQRGNKNIKTQDQLEEKIDLQILDDDFKYIFIDEVQNVKGFEEVVNSYNNDGNYSVFITGSNSYLLSGELTTKLTGRYLEFEIMPLSFYEYLEMKKFFKKEIKDNATEFNEYIRYGGFPKTIKYDTYEEKMEYVKTIVDQIIKKDIKKRAKIRNRYIFNRIMTYIINNYGKTTSLKNIRDYFIENEGARIKLQTIANYLQVLENAKIIYKVQRFDMKSRRSLRGEEKYYLADLSIYYANNVDARINYGPALENVVFSYLKSNKYEISIGKIKDYEVDFICRKNFDDYFYIQVAMTILANEETEDREYRPFEIVKDNYPKYLFTLDQLEQRRDGVMHRNLITFLLEKHSL